MDNQNLIQAVPWIVTAVNVFVVLNVRLAISQLETRISEARRQDRDDVQQWVEARYQRKVEMR